MATKLEMAEKREKVIEGEKDEEEDMTVIKHRGWKAMPYVIGNETFEKLGTLGTASNLLVYLTTVFHMKSVAAATLLQTFNGTTNLAPILGAFLSDTYLGRYYTLAFASVASLLGMFVLTLTAAFKKLHPAHCNNNGEECPAASPIQLAFLLLSFLLLVIGAGGIRPCNLAFGADQFDPRTESGRRGINSFFNWYYFTFTIAMMISSTFIIYIQSNISWTLGLGIPAVLMFFSCAFFFLGTNLYVRVKPEGSPYSNVARVLIAAFRKRNLKLPDDADKFKAMFNPPIVGDTIRTKLQHTDQFRCLDKAAILTTSDEVNSKNSKNSWKLSSLQHVEEVKCILRILPVWSAGMLYSIGATQHGTYIVFQALQSDRHFGNSNFQIPAGSFVVFNMLALTIWLPIYDRIFVPKLQRMTKIEGGITLLQRIGIGILISIVALLLAAVVEEKRRSAALRGSVEEVISPMSSLWLIPQQMLFGLSEAFSAIGQVEFYYKQFPENMRSVAGSFFFMGMAISSYLSSLMVMIVHRTTGGDGENNWLAGDLNKGRLDLFYYLTAAIGTLNLIYFIFCAKWYKYKDLRSGEDEVLMGTRKSSDETLV